MDQTKTLLVEIIRQGVTSNYPWYPTLSEIEIRTISQDLAEKIGEKLFEYIESLHIASETRAMRVRIGETSADIDMIVLRYSKRCEEGIVALTHADETLVHDLVETLKAKMN